MPLVECPVCKENNNEIFPDFGMQSLANSLDSTYGEPTRRFEFEISTGTGSKVGMINQCYSMIQEAGTKEILKEEKVIKVYDKVEVIIK